MLITIRVSDPLHVGLMWMIDSVNVSCMLYFLSQDPKKTNGKILGYDVTVTTFGHSEKSVIRSKELNFTLTRDAVIKITANNSVGVSSVAKLMISGKSMLTFVLFVFNSSRQIVSSITLLVYYDVIALTVNKCYAG